MKKYILLIITFSLAINLLSQDNDPYFSFPVIFSKEKLQEDFMQFRSILEDTHPALYDYTDKQVLDSLFNSSYERIDSVLDFSTFLILMTEVISRVGCGHSSLWVPGKFWEVAPAGLFPLKIRILEDKACITGSYNDSTGIPPGSELISINGINLSSVNDRLLSLTSADGFNHSYRLEKVAQNFPVKFALAYGFADNFNIEYIEPGSNEIIKYDLKPVSKSIIDKNKTEKKELSFKITGEGNTALLTINSFGYYSEVNMFHSFIDSVFKVIKDKKIGNLIIDLRGNSGGDPFCASYLWAYLQPEPLPYFDDHYGRYDTLANQMFMPVNHFEGQLYTLIDGNGFSTTGHICGLLKYHQVGYFVGTEMGSTYTCTGNATYPPLDNTGIMVGTARVMRYTAAVKGMDPRRGIIPDFSVNYTQDDLIRGVDKTLSTALNIINNREARKNENLF